VNHGMARRSGRRFFDKGLTNEHLGGLNDIQSKSVLRSCPSAEKRNEMSTSNYFIP
jgi:hypothetical protein